MEPDDRLPVDAPRPVRTFATLSAAVDYLAHCLETNALIGLLGDINDVSRQVGHSKALIDRFKDVFLQLQELHAQHDLRQRFQGIDFPPDADEFQLDGDLARQGDLDIHFLRTEEGWALERIDYL